MSLSNDDDPPEKAKIGYGQPPREHQFRKGKSGNPRGRPTKKRTATPEGQGDGRLSRLILEEAYRPIQIRENGRVEEIPMIQAVLRSLGVAAVKGSPRAQLAISSLVEAVEQRQLNEKHALLSTALEYKQHWGEAISACKLRGVPPPEPVPHPDEMVFDMITGGIIFNGPMDDFEKAEWGDLLAQKAEAEKNIVYYSTKMKSSRKNKKIYARQLESAQKTHDKIASMVPDEETRRTPGFNLTLWLDRERKLREMRERYRKSRKPAG